jgi:hypothetical protein
MPTKRTRRKKLLTVELTIWDEGSTIHFKPGVPDNVFLTRAQVHEEKYIRGLRKALAHPNE